MISFISYNEFRFCRGHGCSDFKFSHNFQLTQVLSALASRTEAVYLADKQMKETGNHNATLSKSISQGVEAEIFEPMPLEAREFLVKFHNGVDEKRDLMNQLKLVKKAG